jgi:DNA-binding XRE family transcriptional regulator
MELKELIEKIVDYRAKHDITQGEFAVICKLSLTTICNIENGNSNPSKVTKKKILNVIEGK